MGVESLEAKLLDAIAKQNALLLTVQKKHPDFAFLLARDVQLQQAQCWLSLSRIRRLAVATSSSTSGGRASAQTPLDRAALDGAAAYLTHARRIYLEGDGGKSKSYLKGQVFVLVEEAELLLLRGQETDALAKYDEAIQRCNAHRDHAMESLVHRKLEALRLDLDTRAKLDELAQSPHENLGDREILQKCFDHVTHNNPDGLLHKEQLAVLARDLGTHTVLSSDETDELWKQIRAHDSHNAREDDIVGVDFHALWRWWMAEDMYEYRSRRMRRHT